MRKIPSILFLVALLFVSPPISASTPATTAPNLFTTERSAQQHCPADTVVWLNLPTGIYHFRGQRWYGNTQSGAYVCEQEADQVGDRATRNGQ